jgi:hypothetical protein
MDRAMQELLTPVPVESRSAVLKRN